MTPHDTYGLGSTEIYPVNNNQLSLNPQRTARLLGAMSVLLILASISGQLAKFVLGIDVRRYLLLFDLGLERNFPTFFSVLLMIGASFLLVVIAKLTSQQKQPDVSKWSILSLGFLAMAYDEGFQVHEYFIEPMRSLMGQENLGAFYYAWVIPGIVLVLVLALFFLRFLIRLPRRTRNTFLIAGTLYIGGSIGVELIGGSYDQLHGYDNLTYNLISTVEEGLELAGLVVFLYGLLDYIVGNFKGITVGVKA